MDKVPFKSKIDEQLPYNENPYRNSEEQNYAEHPKVEPRHKKCHQNHEASCDDNDRKLCKVS